MLTISEDRFRTLADSAPILIWMSGPDKLCTYFNKPWLDFTGRTFEQELGNGWADGVHPDDFDRCLNTYITAFDARQPFRMEYRLRHHTGQFRWIVDTGVPSATTDSTFLGYIGSAIDITEFKQAEEALHKRETFLRMSQRVGHVGSWDWDMATQRVTWSDEMYEIHGLTRDQFDGTPTCAVSLIHPDDRPVVEHNMGELVGGRDAPLAVEYRILRPSGEIRVLWGKGDLFHDAAGTPSRMIGTVVDITERKQAEDERRELEARVLHAQKLESLGVLAGGIAHDFNNLLTAMLGNANLALAEVAPESVAAPLLRDIERAAQRAAELARQMLAYSGKGKFVIQWLRLDTLVHEMARLLNTVVSKKATLHLDLAPASIKGDATQVRQVVMNLITNASDALEGQEGSIVIRTGVKHADTAFLRSPYSSDDLPSGEYAFVEIEDTGSGMSADTLARLFDPFFTTKFTGRGLGLSAVLGIVKGHHGAVKVTSAPGNGTRVQVLLPHVPAREAEASVLDSEHPPPATRRGTILVVEDDETVRAYTRRVLEGSGFQVLEARDGREGIDLFPVHQTEIAAVLLDLTMPGLDGLEVLQQLRRLSTDVPVVVMSGYSEVDVSNRFAGLGANGFIQKPFLPRDLVARLCQLFPS